jgi:lysophospholipase L1-like esterase
VAEGVVRVLVWRGVEAYRRYRTTSAPTFWADIDRGFGVWHRPLSSFHHVMPCWDVTYHANSYGARDIERSRRSPAPRRHVVVGDSYVEGYGVADSARFTNLLEASTGEEFLNFGTAGGFGTVQELVLYRTLGASFEHSDVLLFVLPANDFADNDPAQYPPERYRPYLRRTGHGYETYYTVRFEDRNPGVMRRSTRVLNWLSNRIYLANLAHQAYDNRGGRPSTEPLSYEGFADADLDVMAEAIRELGASAGPRPVTVFLIPIQEDLDQSMKTGRQYRLAERLAASVASAANVHVIDLLPDFVADARQHQRPASAFFLSCDQHWSAIGHAVAAEAVARHLASGVIVFDQAH